MKERTEPGIGTLPSLDDDDFVRAHANAFARFVPQQFLQLLERPSILDVSLGDHVEKEITLLFSDIRDFTSLSESILPEENFRFINSYLSVMEPVVSSHQGFIDKYIGDGIMALFPAKADDAVRCGIDMLRQLTIYNQGRSRAGYVPIRIGIGINTGLVMMGTVGGHNRMDSTVIGDAVNQASRLESLTKSYRASFLISEHTLHALTDASAYHLRFIDRIKVKENYPAQSVFEVFDADPEPLRLAKLETQDLFAEALACYHMGSIEDAIPLLQQCLHVAPDDHPANVYLERCFETQRQGGQHISMRRFDNLWRNDYSVGSEGLDRVHAKLIEQMGKLAHAVGSGGDSDAIADALSSDMHIHFDAEENLMRRYDYPFAAAHQRQHMAFLRTFAQLRVDIAKQERSVICLLMDIQVQLIDRYINHITKSDVHLGHHLQRAGMG
jgi:hemerythrin-like metal-binding protein